MVIIYSNSENKDDKNLTFFDRKQTLEIDFGSRKTLYILKSSEKSDLENQLDHTVFTGLDKKP